MAQNENAFQINNLQQQQLFAQFMVSLHSFNPPPKHFISNILLL
jgi:hypothetical protein